MKNKYNLSINFLINNIDLFICPVCKKNIFLDENSLKCKNNHVYDLNKKGYVCLINSGNLKESKIYNQKLFENRRSFIRENFYDNVYTIIADEINKYFKKKKISILDLGCGEGLHGFKISKKLNNLKNLIGFDYSKVAINMATDFLDNKYYYFIADVNNIPLADESMDCIVDFLSPFNEKEIKRVLKNDGIFIKIVPGSNYLKELRISSGLNEYNQNDLLLKKYKNIEVIETYDEYNITPENMENLINMTPIRTIKNNIQFSKVTINLKIYVIKQ